MTTVSVHQPGAPVRAPKDGQPEEFHSVRPGPASPPVYPPLHEDRPDDRGAREDVLITGHLGVARDVARRFRGKGIADEDLEQVAYLGLVKAARRYDPAKGSDFLAYAVPTIRGELRRHFRDHGWAVRPPRTIQNAQSRIREAQDELVQTLGRSPRPTEIADHLGLDLGTVIEALGANGCYTPTSLDLSPQDFADGEGDGRSLADLLGDDDPRFAATDALASLVPLLARLSEREKTMLRMRFCDGATQSEIGQAIGVSQMQVSRLMSALFARLRDDLGPDWNS
jgi:RNA polymerase sigma-B factor